LFTTYDQIQKFAQNKKSAIERDLVFVPALTGLGCPYWDRKAGGMWIGLSLDTQPMDLMQSILEGSVFRAAEVIAALNEFVAIEDEISIDGGLSANPYFCQILADELDRQFVVQSFAELTALGTAKLAGGNSVNYYLPEDLMQRYSPETDRQKYLHKFKDAVKRAGQWRD
jgi:glycerol kinase